MKNFKQFISEHALGFMSSEESREWYKYRFAYVDNWSHTGWVDNKTSRYKVTNYDQTKHPGKIVFVEYEGKWWARWVEHGTIVHLNRPDTKGSNEAHNKEVSHNDLKNSRMAIVDASTITQNKRKQRKKIKQELEIVNSKQFNRDYVLHLISYKVEQYNKSFGKNVMTFDDVVGGRLLFSHSIPKDDYLWQLRIEFYTLLKKPEQPLNMQDVKAILHKLDEIAKLIKIKLDGSI